MRRLRRGIPGAALLALVLMLGACGSGGDGQEAEGGGGGGGGGGSKGQLTVGSESFPEAQIVGEMYAQVLEDAGYEIERQLNIDTREIRLPAMERGDIDVSPEYLASLLSVVDPETTASTDPAEVAKQLEGPLSEMGLEVLDYSDAVDTNAFVVTPEVAEENDLSAVSDLQPVASEMTLGGPAECPKRPFCIPGLRETYGVEFADFKALEYGPATVAALESGAVDVALLFSTDPIVADRGLVVLEDDKDLQAADNITPLIREDAESGDLVNALNDVSQALTTEEITDLNAQVAVEQEDPADVARGYLEEKGIL
jgi:osmoprotectant transport system substrate-binding protein